MVQPAYILNTRGQSMDALVDPATGTMRAKIAIGSADLSGLTPDGAWEGVATHENEAEVGATDGVVLAAGLDSTGTPIARPIAVDATGALLVASGPASGSLADQSGALVAGAVSETLAPFNADRKYLFVQNLHASEDLWIDFTADAVIDKPSIKIPAGGSFVMEAGFVTPEEVNVIATTIGHKWTAKEG